MNILIWYWGRRGAGPLYALELIHELQHHNDIGLSASIAAGNEYLEAIKTIPCLQQVQDTYEDTLSFLTNSLFLPFIRYKFKEFFRQSKAEIVISIMPHLWSWFVASAVPEAGGKLITIVHDAYKHPGEKNPLLSWRLRRELSVSAGVVALSEHVKQQLVTGYHYPADRIAVIPLGSFVYGDKLHPGVIRRFPVGWPFRFLFFGRVIDYKGLALLLQAFSLLTAHRDDVELYIVGQGDLSPYQEHLKKTPRVTVINRWIENDEVAQIFESSHALVASYTEASQSGSVATAYGSGIPVIVTPVGGLIEQVTTGTNGIIADGLTPEAFHRAMLTILEPSVYDRCSEGIHVDVTNTWSHVTDAILKHCQHILTVTGSRS